jgi:hypothetical protein
MHPFNTVEATGMHFLVATFPTPQTENRGGGDTQQLVLPPLLTGAGILSSLLSLGSLSFLIWKMALPHRVALRIPCSALSGSRSPPNRITVKMKAEAVAEVY